MENASDVPIPVGWKVVIQPKKGKTVSSGGIDVSASVDAQEHLVYLGQIVARGEAAFLTRTAGGLDMSQWKVRPDVGDFVIFAPYGGLHIRRTQKDGKERPRLLLMNDTDIMALVDDPDMYYSWIDV